MKKLSAFLVLALLTAVVFAQSNQGRTGEDQPAAASQRMEQMQAQMQQMQDLMAKMQATEDPAERQRLMNEHMQEMHTAMTAMNELMHQQMGAAGGGAGANCEQGDANCRLNMMQRQQGMMGQRMNMMQMMMGQMMQMNEQMNHQMNQGMMHMQRGPAQQGAN
jgi:hypothetical protein